MVKISTITRTPKSTTRQTKNDIYSLYRDPDPLSQPYQAARELKRASNAAKLTKIFAKPFIAAMQGHGDYVCQIAKNYDQLGTLVSGGYDGEVLVWDVQGRKPVTKIDAFEGRVLGLAVSKEKNVMVCAGDEFNVHLYKVILAFLILLELEKQINNKKKI